MDEVNTPLLRKVLDHITVHPEEWRQSMWATRGLDTPCGTAYCIAGHTAVMSGYDIDWRAGSNESGTLVGGEDVALVAADLLGIDCDPEALFAAGNDMRRIYTVANHYTGGEIEIPATLPDGS